MSDLEYRMNLLVKFVTDVIWYLAQLMVFEVLFRHTRTISGWTVESTRVFMGVLFVTDALYMMFLAENLDHMSDKVRKGELDLLLVKPVNAQFMLSCKKMAPTYAANLFLGTIWLIWAIHQLPESIPLPRLLTLIVTIPCSLAISYSLRFFFSASALILTRAENVTYVWYQIYRLGTRPDTIYPQWLRYTVLTILPVGFLASVPARLVLETSNIWLFAGTIGVATAALYLSTRYWNFVVRSYSSASS